MPAESRSAERQRPAGVGDDGAFQRLAAIAVPPLYRHGAVLAHAPQQVDFLVVETARLRADQGSEHGLWIAPCLKATAGGDSGGGDSGHTFLSPGAAMP